MKWGKICEKDSLEKKMLNEAREIYVSETHVLVCTTGRTSSESATQSLSWALCPSVFCSSVLSATTDEPATQLS